MRKLSKQGELKLNLGSGKNKIQGYLSLDIEHACEPDILWDFINGLPFEDNSVDRIYFFHCIEHIEEKYHAKVLSEIWRVLKPDADVLISYPEFKKCALNYIENVHGQRDFWKNTIFGRQLFPGDFHVSLMDSDSFKVLLKRCGFKQILIQPEISADYNSIAAASKGARVRTYEQNLKEFIFGPDT